MDPSPVPEVVEQVVDQVVDQHMLFLAYFALLTIALLCVHVGSILSLNPFDHDGERKGETVTHSDARWFPIVGSGMLISLYILVKVFGKDILNYVLMIYFGIVGTLALASSFSAVLIAMCPSVRGSDNHHYEIKIPFVNDPVVIDFTRDYFITVPLSAIIVAGYTYSKNWILNNLIAVAFAIQGVERINLGGFVVGAILLGGLFFYDIFWVFGTDVMVTVAKSVDWPIKIMFPRSFNAGARMAMLGLGDIVIPGVFIALILRFDAQKDKGNPLFKRPYYTAVYVAYLVAVVTALVMMHIFQAAQPVLLYIVPMCLGTVVGVALLKGELKELVGYREDGEEEVKEEEHQMETRSKSIKKQQ